MSAAADADRRTSTAYIEDTLVEIWTEVIPFGDIEVDRGFAALGGDSLAAARALLQIKERFDVELQLNEFFDAQTIRNIAYTIREHLLATTNQSRRVSDSREEGLI